METSKLYSVPREQSNKTIYTCSRGKIRLMNPPPPPKYTYSHTTPSQNSLISFANTPHAWNLIAPIGYQNQICSCTRDTAERGMYLP